MSVGWRAGFDPYVITAALQEIGKVDADGTVKFEDAVRFTHLISLLQTAVDFGETEIPEIERYRIISKAVEESRKQKQISPEGLKARISSFTNDYDDLANKEFTLLTSISVESTDDLSTVRAHGHTITFSKKRPVKFEKLSNQTSREKIIGGQTPTNFTVVRVAGNGRTESEAAERALEALDFIRGIWNFILNWGSPHHWSFGRSPKLVNRIRLGPIHTLHKRNGKLASEGLWYEPIYFLASETFNISGVDWSKVKSSEHRIRNKLSKHPYSNDLNNVILRYARSLDNRDLHSAFLGLWSALEVLTDTREAPYKETARRAAFRFEERELYYQVVKHLALFRNRKVHANAESHEIETLIFLLKGIVESLFDFHIINHFKFKTISEAGSFLASPYTIESIDEGLSQARRKISQLEHARSFRML